MAANYSDDIGPMGYPMKLVSSEIVEHMLGWNIPEEHQEMVHEHWRNYPAINKYWHFCLGLIYSLLMISSLIGNGIVIWIFSTATMGQERLCDLALFSIKRQETEKTDFENIIDMFSSQKARKMQLLV